MCVSVPNLLVLGQTVGISMVLKTLRALAPRHWDWWPLKHAPICGTMPNLVVLRQRVWGLSRGTTKMWESWAGDVHDRLQHDPPPHGLPRRM